MIAEAQKIEFRNVVSKYYTFVPSEMQLAIDDFFETIATNDLTPNGPFFYSINTFNQKNENEPILAEFFQPITEDNITLDKETLNFRTYFSVRDMIMTRIDSNFDVKTTESYSELIQYVEKQGLQITAPFFHLIKILDDKKFMEISLGATRVFEYLG
ncbi:DUF5085 family protein [Enterococcus rivorum]|uniref:DUF5085 domain-containing protein n=1 Tax=Enterococcus rivorum TaxID=762845 RepID=A0A1E5KTC1_9ENTE|nr:DUF5085 family protein [Enterococcus rivorum]MBP2099102.1 effector-binding domain-containing protein [Enterococcus rivorum]OEH81106.1 hypothetical protein BCR26_17710 [Enterococcus rivorum]